MSSVIIHAPLYFHGVVTQGHAASAREWDSRRRLAPTSSKPRPFLCNTVQIFLLQSNIFVAIKYFPRTSCVVLTRPRGPVTSEARPAVDV